MRDKCLNCPDYPYVTDENRKQICYRCDLEDAVNEFKATLKKTWLYKFMIKLLDWLETKLEKYWK